MLQKSCCRNSINSIISISIGSAMPPPIGIRYEPKANRRHKNALPNLPHLQHFPQTRHFAPVHPPSKPLLAFAVFALFAVFESVKFTNNSR
jgi:hypothetical protein